MIRKDCLSKGGNSAKKSAYSEDRRACDRSRFLSRPGWTAAVGQAAYLFGRVCRRSGESC